MATALILFSALSLAACGKGGSDSGVAPSASGPITSGCVSGGPGTSASPYVICAAADLAALAGRVNAGTEPGGRFYLLANDIDLSAYRTGADWTPIGNDTNRFQGYFDGNGKTVSRLSIDNSAISYAGLFGVIDGGGEIKNLGIYGASIITSGDHVGGVAGYVGSGSIINCHVTDSTVIGEREVGSIAGTIEDGVLTDCRVTGGAVESLTR